MWLYAGSISTRYLPFIQGRRACVRRFQSSFAASLKGVLHFIHATHSISLLVQRCFKRNKDDARNTCCVRSNSLSPEMVLHGWTREVVMLERALDMQKQVETQRTQCSDSMGQNVQECRNRSIQNAWAASALGRKRADAWVTLKKSCAGGTGCGRIGWSGVKRCSRLAPSLHPLPVVFRFGLRWCCLPAQCKSIGAAALPCASSTGLQRKASIMVLPLDPSGVS